VESRTEYWEWTFSGEAANHHYLVPAVIKALEPLSGGRILDVGCGNGALTARVAQAGHEIVGIDFTSSGITRARESFPELEFIEHDIEKPLPKDLLGAFDVVLSAEVIEHLFLPRMLFTRAQEALGGVGHVVVTTPYHGYLKNLALAATNKFDSHWQTLSDFGHIRFFSEATLGAMARSSGFEPIAWSRAGRFPALAATMVMTAKASSR
jgi:2-polyprenyl-3-methyl-5-hydroxy-6-metoxy-1,4-benzoquinol methylase